MKTYKIGVSGDTCPFTEIAFVDGTVKNISGACEIEYRAKGEMFLVHVKGGILIFPREFIKSITCGSTKGE